MAANVFGNPVTDDTVRLIYPNLKNITAKDRAEVALQFMNADEKATNVSKFVHNLKRDYGTGTSTLCTIYNATGGTLSFLMNHLWEGYVWKSPYPQILQNGQWGGFLHVRNTLTGPSKEACVYKGLNNDGNAREWMLAWKTPRMNIQNRVCTDVRISGYFGSVNWDTIEREREKQKNNHSKSQLGCYSSVSVGAGSSPEFVGIMALSGLSNGVVSDGGDGEVTAFDDGESSVIDISAIFPSLDSKYEDFVDDDDVEAST